MNNYERIKNMSIEQLAEFLTDTSSCDVCSCEMEEYSCMSVGCHDGIFDWLQQESEV